MITARIAVASALLAGVSWLVWYAPRPPARPLAAGADRLGRRAPPRSAASSTCAPCCGCAIPEAHQVQRLVLRRLGRASDWPAWTRPPRPPLRRGRLRQRRAAARHRGGLDARRARALRAPRAWSSRPSTSASSSAPRRAAAAAIARADARAPGQGSLAGRRAGDARARGDGALRARRARGARAARSACARRRSRSALASNSPRRARRRARCATAGHPRGARSPRSSPPTSSSVPKPAPDIYLAACAALGDRAGAHARARGLADRRRGGASRPAASRSACRRSTGVVLEQAAFVAASLDAPEIIAALGL